MHYEFPEGETWSAGLPQSPAWEPFLLSLVLDWQASKCTLRSQFIQGSFLLLNVEIAERE